MKKTITTEVEKKAVIEEVRRQFEMPYQRLMEILGRIDLKKCLIFFGLLFTKVQMIDNQNWRGELSQKIKSFLQSYADIPNSLFLRLDHARRFLWSVEDICLNILEIIGKLECGQDGTQFEIRDALGLVDNALDAVQYYHWLRRVKNMELPFEVQVDSGVYSFQYTFTPLDEVISELTIHRFGVSKITRPVESTEFFRNLYDEYSIFDERAAFSNEYGYSVRDLIQFYSALLKIASNIEGAVIGPLMQRRSIFKHHWLRWPVVTPSDFFNDTNSLELDLNHLNQLFPLLEFDQIFKIISFRTINDFFMKEAEIKSQILSLVDFQESTFNSLFQDLRLDSTIEPKLGILDLLLHPLLEFKDLILLVPRLYIASITEVLDLMTSRDGTLGQFKGEILQNNLNKVVQQKDYEIIFEKKNIFDINGKLLFEMDMGIRIHDCLAIIECKTIQFSELDSDTYYNLPLKEKKYMKKWVQPLKNHLEDIINGPVFFHRDNNPQQLENPQNDPNVVEINSDHYTDFIAILLTNKPIYYNPKNLPKHVKILTLDQFLEHDLDSLK